MAEWDPKKVAELVGRLESEDSFDRLRAIEELEDLTRRTFGFRFNGPAAERQEAIRRWNDWLKEQKRRKDKKSQIQAAVQLAGGVIDLSTLKKAIEEIPAEQIQGYLNAIIAKMKAQPPRCDACKGRPATVQVTQLGPGGVRSQVLCETCARERGDILS